MLPEIPPATYRMYRPMVSGPCGQAQLTLFSQMSRRGLKRRQSQLLSFLNLDLDSCLKDRGAGKIADLLVRFHS